MPRKFVILSRTRGAIESFGTRDLQAFGAAPPVVREQSLTDAEAASIAAEPEVELIVPAMRTRLIEPLAADAGAGTSDWSLQATGAATSKFDGRRVKVAVLDTGIDSAHPAFADVDILERDFSGTGDGDRNGHGTHCAGTILGRDVGQRIGVARGVSKLLVGKVLGDDGGGDSSMIFEAMQWAMMGGANVISMSLGFDFPGMVAEQVKAGWPAELATSNALEAYRGNLRMFDAIMATNGALGPFGEGALVIAAAGNESKRDQNPAWRIAASLPAAASDVIPVAAVGRSGSGLKVAGFSNTMALVSGPGVDVTSAWPGGGLNTISGTSMACPHVAGLAALWWQSIEKDGRRATPLNVKAALIRSATHEGLEGPDFEVDYGQGLAKAP
ncbi:MAG: S8 family serine peptidase [Sphingomonas adhaesiva]|uniref:S8 family peptidase n=1 Tax=Sphingomonas adhaesiva TaxID=28212 RepID=UPI002FF9246B